MSVLLKLKGGTTCFLLPGHRHFYADTIGAAAKGTLKRVVAYTSDDVVALMSKSKRMTSVLEVSSILDWTELMRFFQPFQPGFTRHYFFVWVNPLEDDGPVVIQCCAFGWTVPLSVTLADSFLALRKNLCQWLFGKRGAT